MKIYVVRIGGSEFAYRYIVSIKRVFGFRSDYEEKAIYKALRKFGFWARKDGTLVIKRLDVADYKRGLV